MKKLSLLVASSFLVGTVGMAIAQTKTPVVSHTPVAGLTNSPQLGPHPMPNDVNFKMRQAMELIHKDVHTGKITKAQADSDKAQVMAVRKQELADFKANGNHQLTDTQKSQISSSLDGIISAL